VKGHEIQVSSYKGFSSQLRDYGKELKKIENLFGRYHEAKIPQTDEGAGHEVDIDAGNFSTTSRAKRAS